MSESKQKYGRLISVAAFSFSFAYLLSFLFEGQTLYSLLKQYNLIQSKYIIVTMFAHLIGLMMGGIFARNKKLAKYMMALSIAICFISTIPFYFDPFSITKL